MIRSVRSSQAGEDLVGHAVGGVHRARAAAACLRSNEQAGAAIVRVDDVGLAQMGPDRGGSWEIELVPQGETVHLDTRLAQLPRGLPRGAEYLDLHAPRGDARSEVENVRQRAAAWHAHRVDDFHVAKGRRARAAARDRAPARETTPRGSVAAARFAPRLARTSGSRSLRAPHPGAAGPARAWRRPARPVAAAASAHAWLRTHRGDAVPSARSSPSPWRHRSAAP